MYEVYRNFNQWSWFVRSPRSSSRAKQESILPHIFAVLGVVCGADTTAKIWIKISVGMWLPYKLSHLTSSRGARNDCSKIENNKTQQPENTANNNQILAAVIAHMQDARHPIHRVRIPYSKFSSPKACRNVHESKVAWSKHDSSPSQTRQMTPEGYWCACVRGLLEIVWRHKHANEENTRSLFSRFLRWNFVKVCMLHDIDAHFTM